MDNETKKDYEVGWKRPPKASQFKKGKSGNVNGRPKLKKAFKTDLQEELEEIIAVSDKGKSKSITKQRALLKRLTANALNGNMQALKTLITLIISQLPQTEEVVEALSNDDLAIIQKFIERNVNNGK